MGKIRFVWCDKCNVPLLSDKCDHCGCQGRRIRISPPGDIRPAFIFDYNILREATSKLSPEVSDFFSVPLLLNHVSHIDRMDEVISDGAIIGSIRFNPEKWIFEFVPSSDGIKLLFSYAVWKSKDFWKATNSFRHVIVDKIAGEKISEGFNALAPGIISSSNFSKGDQVAIISEDGFLVGVGKALVNSEDIESMSRGVVIKNRVKALRLGYDEATSIIASLNYKRATLKSLAEKYQKEEHFNISDSLYLSNYDPFHLLPREIEKYWKFIIRCNLNYLKKIEREAIKFINTMVSHEKEIACISFSGGKDSIVSLELTRLSGIRYQVLFVDTGIELPETTKYALTVLKKIRDLNKEKPLVKRYRDTLVVFSNSATSIHVPRDRFWNGVEKLGLPGMDWRWCCKSNKLAPLRLYSRIIKQDVKISIVGVRRYESFQRAAEGKISRNPWTGQTNIHPIYDWNALEVWLFILWRRLPTNPLYEKGFFRIGCWPCPANNLADLNILKTLHPDLFNKLKTAILSSLSKEHLSKNDMMKVFQFGLWRWRKVPKKMLTQIKLLRPSKKIIKVTRIDDTSFFITIDASRDEIENALKLVKKVLKNYSKVFEITKENK